MGWGTFLQLPNSFNNLPPAQPSCSLCKSPGSQNSGADPAAHRAPGNMALTPPKAEAKMKRNFGAAGTKRTNPIHISSVSAPAYQNLRQKVDNFVSTHLDKQEWNPAMNKNQLRNGLRQSVIQSGMLEAGVDRIISQVVDPKLNHIFRPQIERAIHEFLAAQKKEENVPAPPPEPENKDPPAPSQDAS
uniref:BOD1/SHG1 domain-containing protein n=1 Tax=Zonotrichia albicollis TaxID=44394 RepID=A0A8D2MXM5_ZONAL